MSNLQNKQVILYGISDVVRAMPLNHDILSLIIRSSMFNDSEIENFKKYHRGESIYSNDISSSIARRIGEEYTEAPPIKDPKENEIEEEHDELETAEVEVEEISTPQKEEEDFDDEKESKEENADIDLNLNDKREGEEVDFELSEDNEMEDLNQNTQDNEVEEVDIEDKEAFVVDFDDMSDIEPDLDLDFDYMDMEGPEASNISKEALNEEPEQNLETAPILADVPTKSKESNVLER